MGFELFGDKKVKINFTHWDRFIWGKIVAHNQHGLFIAAPDEWNTKGDGFGLRFYPWCQIVNVELERPSMATDQTKPAS